MKSQIAMPAPEIEQDSAHLVDQKIVDQLKADMGEDIDIVLEAFSDSIRELIAQLKSIDVQQNITDVQNWSHSLKSSAASIGAMKLSAQSAYIEQCIKLNRDLDIVSEVNLLLDLADQSLAGIANL